MKILNMEQRTDEWFEARLGLFTASSFSKIITPKTGKLSAQAQSEINKKIAEMYTGKSEVFIPQTDAMLRGMDLEAQALEFFNFTNNYDFKEIGFVDSEKGYGCSPDGIDLENKMGLELKAPLSHTHIAYLRSGEVPSEYVLQIQGSLMITGLDKWVFGSYHPDLPCVCIEVERDEELINKLRAALDECVKTALEVYENLPKIKSEVSA